MATGEGPESWQPQQSRKNGSARELRARHGVRSGSLDSLGADLGVRERGCARLVGPRTVATSSRMRMRVVRNPLNVMARLAEVVGRNGTSKGSVCAARSFRLENLECLNDEDLNEPNIAIRRVNKRSGDSAPRESVLPAWTFGVEFSVPRCSGIVVISVFRGRALKARRETFMTTETSFGKPSRVPEGHLKLVPRPWWSLGVCRPVFGCRLLVSEAGPESPHEWDLEDVEWWVKGRSPWKAVKCEVEARGKQ
ncbi:hypothetical protein CRG98_029258 [Punica granatum]|uniref:Uncharacterized protein n=1 Tax=Punica granatum TaxID=22663 RepID=A0A2I0J277_PUNGR|nr:hypothetical protein CRG98_029258 [Punica granatum]